MEPHIGAKFQEIPALGYGDTQDRTDGRTDGRTNGTEFQGPIPPSSGDQQFHPHFGKLLEQYKQYMKSYKIKSLILDNLGAFGVFFNQWGGCINSKRDKR